MARSSTAASKRGNAREDAARSSNSGRLSREQRLEYSPPLEDYVLPQTSDIVMALRKLAAY
jgi:hypothetical protein